MTDVYTDTEYNVTMLAVLAEHRGFAIRKMPLKFGTGGLKMTIDEAISHAIEVAEQEECFINYPHSDIVRDDLNIESRKHYVAEQRQLAEWLTELKELREENKVLTSECDKLIKEICVKHGNCSYADSFKWCRADIALKLIGETNDEP